METFDVFAETHSIALRFLQSRTHLHPIDEKTFALEIIHDKGVKETYTIHSSLHAKGVTKCYIKSNMPLQGLRFLLPTVFAGHMTINPGMFIFSEPL